jgi:hypothetical protein
MTREEWDQVTETVADAMRLHTRPYVTPLSRETDTTVLLEGSGSYIERPNCICLLTCEHVLQRGSVDYRFHGSENVYGYRRKWTAAPHPVDMAIGPLTNSDWHATQHHAAPVPYARFAAKHQLSDPAELLFFRGYAGENAGYGFGVHQANGTGYCSQELKESGNASIFEIFWEPQHTRFTAATDTETRAAIKLDDPQGFSGSLVWNTRYLETKAAGQTWTPECAVVTGQLRRWDTGTKTLLVYRVEHVRAWLDQQP